MPSAGVHVASRIVQRRYAALHLPAFMHSQQDASWPNTKLCYQALVVNIRPVDLSNMLASPWLVI